MKAYFTYCLLLLLSLSSCYRDFELDQAGFTPHIVMHGFVQADSLLQTHLSRSWLIGMDPADSLLQDPRLSLYINDNPADPLSARPRGGDQVRVVVEAEGVAPAEAIVRVPEKIAIDQVKHNVERTSVLSCLLHTQIELQDPPQRTNYYGIQVLSADTLVSIIQLDIEQEPLFDPLYKHGILDDLVYEKPYRISQSHTYPFSDQAIAGQRYQLDLPIKLSLSVDVKRLETCTIEVCICLHSLSESYYKYLLSLILQNVNQLSKYGLADPSLTYMNVKNGWGVLAAYQTDTCTLRISLSNK